MSDDLRRAAATSGRFHVDHTADLGPQSDGEHNVHHKLLIDPAHMSDQLRPRFAFAVIGMKMP
jgi:hypothetical protein